MRYLALDLGDRRIGVARSDALGMIARPLEMFERRSRAQDYRYIQDLIADNHVEALIVGLPLNMDGTEGSQADWVRDYVSELEQEISIPVHFWDERLTTEEAKDILRAQGKTASKEWIDAVGAAVILQRYLDAHAG